jgi:predicted DNA-binding protein (UPF0251 family)
MRKRGRRNIARQFKDTYYKPRGIPLRQLGEVGLSHEDLEVLRLRYQERLTQEQAANKMGISQSQYQRDYQSLMEKLTDAFINCKAIKIEKE